MNKLWILRPNKENDRPWSPWYDKMFGFVIRASSAEEARRIASKNSGDEGEEVWLSSKYSSCKHLTQEGEEGVVLEDFHSA